MNSSNLDVTLDLSAIVINFLQRLIFQNSKFEIGAQLSSIVVKRQNNFYLKMIMHTTNLIQCSHLWLRYLRSSLGKRGMQVKWIV
jgi:alpha-amylase/alpha-mannosidase (GH57 family)